MSDKCNKIGGGTVKLTETGEYSTLDTTDKQIIGGINENKNRIDNAIGIGQFTSKTDPATDAITQSDIDDFIGCVITLTGAGNDQTLLAPTVDRNFYTVINDDASTHSIDIIGGSTVCLDPGKFVQFVWDGSAWVATSGGSVIWIDDGANIKAIFSTRNLDMQSGGISGAELDIDNININGNVISSTDTDGDIELLPDGDGGFGNKAPIGASGYSVRLNRTGVVGLDQFNTVENSTAGITTAWQSFTSGVNGVLDSVEVKMHTTQAATIISLTIKTGTGTGGSTVATQTGVTLIVGWNTIVFTVKPQLVKDSVYSIIIGKTGGPSTPDWRYQSTDVYAGGSFVLGGDGTFRTNMILSVDLIQLQSNGFFGFNNLTPAEMLDIGGTLKAFALTLTSGVSIDANRKMTLLGITEQDKDSYILNDKKIIWTSTGLQSGTERGSITFLTGLKLEVGAQLVLSSNSITLVAERNFAQKGGQFSKLTPAGAADYNPSALTRDYRITVDNTAAPRNVIISNEDIASGSPTLVRTFIIKDQFRNAGTNNITVSGESGTIEGAANAVIAQDGASISIYSDGTNLFIE